MPEPSEQPKPDIVPEGTMNRTTDLREYLLRQESDLYDEPSTEYPTGRYLGYPLMERDSPINGYVSYGKNREAIRIDDEINPEVYDRIYNVLVHRIQSRAEHGKVDETDAMEDIMETVKTMLPYNRALSDQMRDEYRNQLVDLSQFAVRGGGACRHQAPLAAYLMERLGRVGFLEGKPSNDRKTFGKVAHAWARYTNPHGRVYIVDPNPSANYAGPLEKAPDILRNIYSRPDDLPEKHDPLSDTFDVADTPPGQ